MKNMTFSGYLSTFSLPEIFEFLEQGYKTGLLRIRALKDNRNQETENHYIWLRQGRIVAAANRLDNQGLVSMIAQRGWVKESIATEKFQASGNKMAMGLCLKSEGLLSAEQLTLLFRAQIMGQVSPLFELENGKFDCDFQADIPTVEMTGLSMLTTEATIKGLRNLRNWSALSAKLPDPTSGISKKMAILPSLQLDSQESKVWDYANNQTSLNEIANQLSIPLEKVRQIAFRLIVSNLAEEAFIVVTPKKPIHQETQKIADLYSTNGFGELTSNGSTTNVSTFKSNETTYALNSQKRDTATVDNKLLDPITAASSQKMDVSQSFLENLVGFLKQKF
ncbi:MAG: DUF4388 domain-containing protein [Cyanobacteria bacterium P01_D01_bin.50]